MISPYVIQSNNGAPYEDGTFYTQVNFTRTIEQILCIKPMNQNDLVASPTRTLFIDTPPESNFAPFNHVPAAYAINTGNTQTPTQNIPSCSAKPQVKAKSSPVVESKGVQALRAGWMAKKAQVFAGNQHKPDVEDSDTVNHLNWYEATGFTRPYPGEKTVRPASEFNRAAPVQGDGDDD